MNTLLIDDDDRSRIKNYVNNSKLNPLSEEYLKSIISNDSSIPGDLHSLCFRIGFRVVYTEEFQPMGKARHLSVSLNGGGEAPHIAAVDMLLLEFGFKHAVKSDKSFVYPEAGNENIINVLELIDE